MKIKQLTPLINELSKLNGVLGIMLFGSRARGDYHRGSDIDIALIYKTKRNICLQKEIEILSKYASLYSVISFTKSELIKSPLRRALIKDGILLYSKNHKTKDELLSVKVPVMPDKAYHEKLAKEKFEGVKVDFKDGRYSCVGDQAIKVLEQLIDACTSKDDIHFHEHPRSAHRNREKWLKKIIQI